MKLAKKFLFVTALLALNAIIFAQSKESETNVENEYLTDVDGDIIMSLATSDELDNKLVALQYLQNAIEEGNTSDLVIKALDQLAGHRQEQQVAFQITSLKFVVRHVYF